MLEDLKYKEEILIDPNNLDLECLHQPSLFMKYSEMMAQAEANYDVSKRNLDRVIAKISLQIRKNKKLYIEGSEKLTESMIQCLLDDDETIQDAQDEVGRCKHELKILTGIVSAFEQRKRSLNNLVTLYGQQYFSGPDTMRQLNRDFIKTQAENKTKEKILAKLNQRKTNKTSEDI
jgi:hypothetical protein